MPRVRQPVVKGNHSSQRLECPSCGMRTRQSTSGPDWDAWEAVMGGPTGEGER